MKIKMKSEMYMKFEWWKNCGWRAWLYWPGPRHWIQQLTKAVGGWETVLGHHKANLEPRWRRMAGSGLGWGGMTE